MNYRKVAFELFVEIPMFIMIIIFLGASDLGIEVMGIKISVNGINRPAALFPEYVRVSIVVLSILVMLPVVLSSVGEFLFPRNKNK